MVVLFMLRVIYREVFFVIFDKKNQSAVLKPLF